MALHAQLARLNAAAAATGELPVFSSFRLEEDTVLFEVHCAPATGALSLSLHERSAYPATGALVFADGSDALLAAVEAVAPAISQSAALDCVIERLADVLDQHAHVALQAQLSDYIRACTAEPAGSGDSSSMAITRTIEQERLSTAGSSDDEGSVSEFDAEMDDDHYDLGFSIGDELDDRLLRMRLAWEEKDAQRRATAALHPHALPSSADAHLTSSSGSSDGLQVGGKAGAAVAKRRGDKAAAAGRKRGAAAQIFSATEATRILCNELSALIREKAEGFEGINADCVDLDVHHWRVEICDITPDCPLKADLAELRRTHGYGHIEFGLRFQPDMHPFYPVHLQVLRPRFRGVVAEALMSHPIFSLQGWDPMKSIKSVLRFAQNFLETHGRVALDDPRNGPPLAAAKANEAGLPPAAPPAYSDAEIALFRLELLAGLRPSWAADNLKLLQARDEAVDTERIRELNFGKRHKRVLAAHGDGRGVPGGWEAGVGYGHSGTEGGQTWDIATTEAAQAQQDAETRALLCDVITAAVADSISPQVATTSSLLPLLWQQLRFSSLLDIGSRPERALKFAHVLSLVRAVGRSPSISFLLDTPAAGASGCATGAGAGNVHPSTIREALPLVVRQAEFILARQPAEADGAGAAGAMSPEAYQPLDTCAAVAAAVAATMRSEASAQPGAQPGLRGIPRLKGEEWPNPMAGTIGLDRSACNVACRAAQAAEEVYMIPLARHIIAVARDIQEPAARQRRAPVPADSDCAHMAEPSEQSLQAAAREEPHAPVARSTRRNTAAPPLVATTCSASSSLASSCSSTAESVVARAGAQPELREPTAAPVDGLSDEERYTQRMGPLQFEAVEDITGHYYMSKAPRVDPLPARSRRLALEAADMMGGSLPLAASSTIWCRLHESQMHFWRAMISGPDGTPYAGGLFIFDIFCSDDYPNSPPKVNLCTTGGGSVRFNPNLYNCGKVCLSLLGTWQGEQAESWHPKTSTLLQVLMSVQGLILVPDPFFNEPGFERIRGTPHGNNRARGYNEVIREATIRYAMIDNLRKPPPELREAILTHFALRRDEILANVRSMATEETNSRAHATRMCELVRELEETLDTYAPPSLLTRS